MPRLVQVFTNEQIPPTLCDPKDVDILTNDFCIVRDIEGREVAGYAGGFEHVCEAQMNERTVPTVLRRAQSSDVRAWHSLKKREVEGLILVREKVIFHKLDMKVTRILFEDTMHKVIFYFTADQRVDFRELVKDLATAFHARIELWQVGVRDEARVIGGLGGCGQMMCCATWMRDFVPVSIRYAKVQDIQFSPTKLSGMCGRLRCCLSYEQKQYQMLSKGVPPVGAMVQMDEYGEAKVVDRNLLARTLTIYSAEGKHTCIRLSEFGRIKAVRSENRTCKGQVVWEIKRGRPDEDDDSGLFLEEEPEETEAEISDREFAVLTDKAEAAAGGDTSRTVSERQPMQQREQGSQRSPRPRRGRPTEKDGPKREKAAQGESSERPKPDRNRRRTRPAEKKKENVRTGKDAPKGEKQGDESKPRRRRSRGGGQRRPGGKPEGGGENRQSPGEKPQPKRAARPAAKKGGGRPSVKKDGAKPKDAKGRGRTERKPASSSPPSK